MANILLAEDDESMLNFLVLALSRAGHNITAKTNGLETLIALEKNPITYDLLLTDIIMPGLDGVELAEKATNLNPKIKIMFITGFAAITLNKQEKSGTQTQTLSKPFHINDLVQQVEALLSS